MEALSVRYNPEKALKDLKGKVALVTGGNRGVGLRTVQILAERGAKVYLGARDENSARQGMKKIESEGLGSLGGSVVFIHLDISHPKLAKEAASRFMGQESRLDILVNNAALLPRPYGMTDIGVQDVMATNQLGTFALTEALMPVLKQSAAEPESDVRIVNVSSITHKLVAISTLQGKESFNVGMSGGPKGELERYGLSKLANLLHIKELQRRILEEKVQITCIALSPGGVASPGFLGWLSSWRFIGGVLPTLLKPLCLNEREGAMTSAFAAASKEIENDKGKYQGQYLVPFGKLRVPSRCGTDVQLAKELWDTTEALIEQIEKHGSVQ